jgi:hypothetical protein
MIILGAGLAGCIAAHLFPGARVYEGAAEGAVGEHSALLRFRSDDIAKITGIPFRKVRVRKAVVYGAECLTGEMAPHILNDYARKVTGRLMERSIGSLAPVERWVAPEDLHARLLAQLEGRVTFDWPVERVSGTALWSRGETRGVDRTDEPVVSTLPLDVMLELTGVAHNVNYFRRAPIHVRRYRVEDCDVYQTLYFPHPSLNTYRASITGDTLIVESMDADVKDEEQFVMRTFGLLPEQCTLLLAREQRYGKLVELSAAVRQSFLLALTQKFGVYSLGRFATWRNLLLDDLPADAEKIRGLIRMTEYERKLEGLS